MTLKLTKGRIASQNDIIALEHRIGEPLVPEILEFVAQNDGAEPETNIFKVGTANESGVNSFIPIREIISEMRRVENLPDRAYPIAWAEGGNYVFVNQADDGAVYFWDHEQPCSLVKLANGFRSFLELLVPFDVSSIKLKPGQVKKVWIDSAFLKEFQG